MVEYYQYLQKNFKPVTQKILSNHFSTPTVWTPIQITAALHYYIKRKIDYETRDTGRKRRDLRGPVQTWKNGGNCEEKTILLCNLFHTIKNVETRKIAVDDHKPDAGHLLAQVGFAHTSAEITGKLDSYYQYLENEHGYTTEGRTYCYSHDTTTGIMWYVADPEMSSYLGDISNLENQGYIERDSSGNWDWRDHFETHTPP